MTVPFRMVGDATALYAGRVQPSAVTAAASFIDEHAADLVREFADLVSVPNVSRVPGQPDLAAAAVADLYVRSGVELTSLRIDGAPPLLTGRIDVGAERTVGIYVHYDGQPVDPDEWTFGPFVPTLVSGRIDRGGEALSLPVSGDPVDPEWRLYARGTADDRAPLFALAVALRALAAGSMSPAVNLVFAFEGEEEIGSVHLADYFAANRDALDADLWLICDGPVHRSGLPQIVFGVRGITEMEITVHGPNRPLHSGHYGNWVFNPVQELARILASMKDDEGRVLVDGFYDSTIPPGAAELAAARDVPRDDAELRRELGIGATEGSGASLLERLFLPSLNVRGLDGGPVGDLARNVIPTAATASLDLRLVPGNDPSAMAELVRRHVERQGFHVIDGEPGDDDRGHARVATVRAVPGYPGVRLPMDDPAAAAVVDAARAAGGGEVLAVPTFGGSVPLFWFTEILRAPVVLVPIANHDNNQHAADENLRIGNLWYGVRLMAALCHPD